MGIYLVSSTGCHFRIFHNQNMGYFSCIIRYDIYITPCYLWHYL